MKARDTAKLASAENVKARDTAKLASAVSKGALRESGASVKFWSAPEKVNRCLLDVGANREAGAINEVRTEPYRLPEKRLGAEVAVKTAAPYAEVRFSERICCVQERGTVVFRIDGP